MKSKMMQSNFPLFTGENRYHNDDSVDFEYCKSKAIVQYKINF